MKNPKQKLTFKLSEKDGQLSKDIEAVLKKEAKNKKPKPANPNEDA